MKLLLDENLSRRLVPALQPSFAGRSHVALLGLERSTDAQLCDYAARHGFVIGSKDDDFQRLVVAALLAAADRLEIAFSDPATGVVVIE